MSFDFKWLREELQHENMVFRIFELKRDNVIGAG